ncbi:hypothetical protein LOD99_6548 [Oopsacas minuta]|uniref:Uncharacterized protein n=1 Tax=Oopsacas minuta TaxID=111878 RepID=A0AAV7JMK4_9METZ|nr:hypothetical protein LOD99_6548 [Oopsacas minuta]
MEKSSEANTINFLSNISSHYKDILPQLSRHINLDSELILDTNTYTKNRCKTHCPHCYTLFVPGINYSIRTRTLKKLRIIQKMVRIESVTGYGNSNIMFSRRRLSYWTILCRTCKTLFVDFSYKLVPKKSRKQRGISIKGKFSKLSLETKLTQKLSRKKRIKNAKIQKTKMKILEKRKFQSIQPKPVSLKDFLIDCDIKL